MKALVRKVVIGVMAAILASCGVRAAPAQWGSYGKPHPFPHPNVSHFHPYFGPYYHHHHDWPVVVASPVVYEGTAVVASPDPVVYAANPVPAANIRLSNPASNRRALSYSVNGGPVQVLQPGSVAQFDQQVAIRFDRGGGSGMARYVLQDGSYRFLPVGGYWSLARDDDAAGEGQSSSLAVNPLPGN